jgi:hypothetical protein
VLLLCRAPIIVFKALTAGDASTPSGAYIHYQDNNALEVGIGTAPANVNSFTSIQDCKVACDAVPTCLGFSMKMVLYDSDMPKTCVLLSGINDPAQSTRSFVRADATRLQMPTLI